MSEVTEVKQIDTRTAFINTVLDIVPTATEEQAGHLFVTIDGLLVGRLQDMFADPAVLQDIFLNMQSIQLQNVAKYRNVEAQLNQVELLVIEEENEYTDVRVNYVDTDTDTWYFEQRIEGKWERIELGNKERLSLVGTAGKYFDGRTDRYGYIITSDRLDNLATKASE